MILAVCLKEWILLWRDKVGLIFLFILPMCLVLFITLSSSEDLTSAQQLKLLLVNQEVSGDVSQGLVKALKNIDGFAVTEAAGKQASSLDAAKKSVANGDYQALLIIPNHISQTVANQVRQQLQGGAIKAADIDAVQILFDPALPKNLQEPIKAGVQILTATLEINLWRQMAGQVSRVTLADPADPRLIQLHTDYVKATGSAAIEQPNDVQQNVPAWALFGMFFIITPLSGIIVKERQLGVMSRLHLAPVSLLSLIWGKIAAFVGINLLQLILMLAVGVLILPLFGLPMLNVTSRPGAIIAVGLAASLAATGFGMLIGSLVKTPEQANVVGPFIIVIMAAVGGVFVPAYLLPEAMKKITDLSPMHWALQSFIDIFVRNADVVQLLPNIGKLLAFSLLTMTVALLVLARYRR